MIPVTPAVSMNFLSGSNTGKWISQLSRTLNTAKIRKPFEMLSSYVSIFQCTTYYPCNEVTFLISSITGYPALVFFNFKSVNFVSINGLNLSPSVLFGWLRPFHLQAWAWRNI